MKSADQLWFCDVDLIGKVSAKGARCLNLIHMSRMLLLR